MNKLSSVLLRIITAFIAIPLALAVLWFGGWWAYVGVIIIVALAEIELIQMTLPSRQTLSFAGVFAFSCFLVGANLYLNRWGNIFEISITALIIFALLSLLLPHGKNNISPFSWALIIGIPFYIAWPLGFLIRIRGMQVGMDPGSWLLLTFLLSIWANDSLAFFIGKSLGKHKLAPAISPAKTWEGAIAGFLGGTAAFMFVGSWWGLQTYHSLILGALVAVSAELGDLVESQMKRLVNVKDSGNLMPGHGGILDRIDSLLLASLPLYLYASMVLHIVQ